ncbi:LOC109579995 [Sergentomyia squamirostris]
MLIGTATRFIAGRNVAQTVYWRTSADGARLIKTNKTINFGPASSAPESTTETANRIAKHEIPAKWTLLN